MGKLGVWLTDVFEALELRYVIEAFVSRCEQDLVNVWRKGVQGVNIDHSQSRLLHRISIILGSHVLMLYCYFLPYNIHYQQLTLHITSVHFLYVVLQYCTIIS